VLREHQRTGTPVRHFIERDDGLIDSMTTEMYFSGPRDWPQAELDILAAAGERVLDIGCGAGRHALWLQGAGHRVTAIDPSAGAVAVTRARGIRRARVMGVEQVSPALGRFDSFLMIGHNLGLLRSEATAQRVLSRLAHAAAPGASIIGTTLDPLRTSDPAHRAYHRRNRARGRLPGQLRLRVRYRDLAGAWFDYLFLTQPQLRRIVAASPWHLERIVPFDPHYGVVLRLK
jgi:SAM-dependent methyltransferase